MDIQKIKKELKEAYDKDSKRRSDKSYHRDSWKTDTRQNFLDLIVKEEKKSLLELGAGVGIDSKFFSDNGLEVLAADLSEGMVEACKGQGLNAELLDLYEVSSLGKKFDAVYAMNVLLHVPKDNLDEVLREISEVLNDTGLFYMGVYGGFDEEKTIVDNQKMGLPRFFSFLSDDSLLSIAEKHFEIVDFKKVDIGSRQEGFHYQSLTLRNK